MTPEEEVARAICKTHGLRQWDELTADGQLAYRNMARAVMPIIRNADLEEAAKVARGHATYGHVIGNDRAAFIAQRILALRSREEGEP